MAIPLIVPVVVAVGSASALAWDTIDEYLRGDDPQPITVTDGGVVNIGDAKPISTGQVLTYGGLLLGAVYLYWQAVK